MYNKLVLLVVGALLALAGFLVSTVTPVALKGTVTGVATSFATSSAITVPNYVGNGKAFVNAFASTSLGSFACSSRVISTGASAISLTFGEIGTTTIPTNIFGHQQAGSTTVAYGGDSYGCGNWKVTGVVGASVITVTEFR